MGQWRVKQPAPSISGGARASWGRPRTITDTIHSIMAKGKRKGKGRVALDQYPGFDLSISELCHALKIKLSRYASTIADPLSATDSIHYSRHSSPLPLVRMSQQTRPII